MQEVAVVRFQHDAPVHYSINALPFELMFAKPLDPPQLTSNQYTLYKLLVNHCYIRYQINTNYDTILRLINMSLGNH